MFTTFPTGQVHIVQGGPGGEEEHSVRCVRAWRTEEALAESGCCEESQAPPVGAVLQAKSEGLVAPAHKHHACVTWGPESLRGDHTGGEFSAGFTAFDHSDWLLPVQVRYVQALPPRRRRCPLRCPGRTELDSSY